MFFIPSHFHYNILHLISKLFATLQMQHPFPRGLTTKILDSAEYATYTAHQNILDLTTLTILHELVQLSQYID
jgi:hypothetical protein